MLKFDELPAMPQADRIFVRPQQPREDTDTGRLFLPDVAKTQAHAGTIIAAGLRAMDIMYDNGQEIGDEIWYGQFAGTWEEWDHIVKPGKDSKCKHESWDYEPSLKMFRGKGFKCSECGALRQQEPLLIMNVGDVLCNVESAARVRSGDAQIIRGVTADGKTCHFIRRRDEMTISTSSNGVAHVTA